MPLYSFDDSFQVNDSSVNKTLLHEINSLNQQSTLHPSTITSSNSTENANAKHIIPIATFEDFSMLELVEVFSSDEDIKDLANKLVEKVKYVSINLNYYSYYCIIALGNTIANPCFEMNIHSYAIFYYPIIALFHCFPFIFSLFLVYFLPSSYIRRAHSFAGVCVDLTQMHLLASPVLLRTRGLASDPSVFARSSSATQRSLRSAAQPSADAALEGLNGSIAHALLRLTRTLAHAAHTHHISFFLAAPVSTSFFILLLL